MCVWLTRTVSAPHLPPHAPRRLRQALPSLKQETMRTETGGPYASREDAVKAALKAAMATGTCICDFEEEVSELCQVIIKHCKCVQGD